MQTKVYRAQDEWVYAKGGFLAARHMFLSSRPRQSRQLSRWTRHGLSPEGEKQEFFPQPPRTASRRPGKQMRSTQYESYGIGFSIELKAFPIDGRLVVLPPDTDDRSR
jgi:hypothetical protein